jgi:DNA repair protein RecN (Recombination protein N)
MLENLHVKNLALIDEADVDFGEGLHILTGETGAGKSILLGSINIALGQKVPKEMLREDAPYALVELVFSLDENKRQLLMEEGIEAGEEESLIITRKITGGRSTVRINGENVSLHTLQKVTSHLIDIHGQHDHQSLLYKKKHLEILDAFGKAELEQQKQRVSELYHQWQTCKKEAATFNADEETRMRECAYLEYVVSEIAGAGLKEGEEEQLEAQVQKLQNGQQILSGMQEVVSRLGDDGGVQDGIGSSVAALSRLAALDSNLSGLYNQLMDLEAVCEDCFREANHYVEDFSFDEEALAEMETRLDCIRNLQSKYGHTVAEVLEFAREKETELERLQNYEIKKQEANRKLEQAYEKLVNACQVLTNLRCKTARALEPSIIGSLQQLNFLEVQFEVSVQPLEQPTAEGMDQVEFMISTNPGQPLRPLAKVASGGELSRIMLAIKTILSKEDDIDTLIFDEIDTGISGRTAQMVSKQMAKIGANKQVICITHLPQIAAMADKHYKIEKSVINGKTKTSIAALDEEESVLELARLLGGEEITDAVMLNAREMKELAEQTKL